MSRYSNEFSQLQNFGVFRTILQSPTTYRSAGKSLARPGRKQVTTINLYLMQATQKKIFRRLSVQPGLRGSNDLRVGRKMATFQLFFCQSGRAKELSTPLY